MNGTRQSPTATELYRQAIRLAQAGEDAQALEHVERFLKARPAHGPAWHLAGKLLMKCGQMQQALDALRHCCPLSNRPKEALLDLAKAYLKAEKPCHAAGLLKSLKAEGLWDNGLALRIAGQLSGQQDWAGAMEILLKGQALSEDSAVFEEPIRRLREKRAKIAFFCGGDGMTFLKDIADYLGRRYPIRFFEGSSSRQMAELMEWSDISWFEWATNLAQLGSQLPKNSRTIVRLHRYEAYEPWPKLIQWSNVDLLITVGNSFVIEAMEQWVPGLRQQTAIATLPNGVNVESIPFRRRVRGKNIAFIGALRMVKNPMYLLQCMAHLHQIDPEYRLFIAGENKDVLMDQYFQHQIRILGLEKVIHFDGWQSDIQSWLADKHYLAVTSVIESQGMGVLEAMAAGVKPVIHNFPGSEEIYGKSFLFSTPEEFCRPILSEEYEPRFYREFVEQRYPLSRTLLKINEILASFEKMPCLPVQETPALITRMESVKGSDPL